MSKNKKSSQFSRVYKTDKTTLIPIIQGSPLFNAIITPEDFAKGLSPYIEIDNTEFVEKLDAIELELPNKVDKIEGYSLLADTEIEKLAALTDTGDIDLSAVELTENKQNSLEEDTLGVKFPTVNAVNEGLDTKVDKEYGMSLVDDEEILRLSSVVNQDISNLVEKEAGKSLIDDTEIARLATLENVSIEHLATKEELENKVDKEEGKSLVSDEEILRLSTVTNQDISNLATKGDLENLVVKEEGKSLILDTEIERLESVTNQTLEGLGAEDANNKKSLLNPLSETEYPNSKAVADYVTDSLPEDNRDTLNQVTATGTYTLPLNRQTQITEELTGSNTFILTDPFEGIVNESVVHFRVGSDVPTLVYDFTPKWLNEAEIELKADKSYTIVFEQLKQGVE